MKTLTDVLYALRKCDCQRHLKQHETAEHRNSISAFTSQAGFSVGNILQKEISTSVEDIPL